MLVRVRVPPSAPTQYIQREFNKSQPVFGFFEFRSTPALATVSSGDIHRPDFDLSWDIGRLLRRPSGCSQCLDIIKKFYSQSISI